LRIKTGIEKMTAPGRFFGLLFIGLILPAMVSAQTVFLNPDYQYIVDIPVGWEILDGEQTEFISFTDSDHVAVFQIVAFPGDRFATSEELEKYIIESYDAQGDRASFRYLDRPAVFGDYRFSTDDYDVRGYMAFLNRDDFDFAVMTFVPEDYYEEYHDLLLSVLDSFSPDRLTRNYPGPVSQFFLPLSREEYADGEERSQSDETENGAVLSLPGGSDYRLPGSVGSDEVRDATQTVIEREARVLSEYAPQEGESPRIGNGPAPAWAVAWRRYFRMIYRDSFSRLEPVAEALFMDLTEAGVNREEMPAEILSWLQGAEYRRTPSLSDLMSPSACLVDFAGDCDSLGITYAILLHHLGFDAILMASIEYAHAMVGVDIPGEGARFPYEGRKWLVAELTEDVAIGQIAQDMSDIGGWIGVKLDPTVQY
jgi:hypothetical protein